jgi:hypothetical protein
MSIGRSHPRGKASTSIVEALLSDNLFERIVGLIGQLVPITPLTFPHDSDAAEINDFVPERSCASDKSNTYARLVAEQAAAAHIRWMKHGYSRDR